MKNYLILLTALILTSLNALGQNDKQFKFKIDGTINADTGTVTLHFFTDYIPKNDSDIVAKVNNGKFSIAGYLPEPQSVIISFGDNYLTSDFIIEKGLQTISINTDIERQEPEVSNSTMQNEYPRYTAFFKQHTIKRNICDQKYDSIFKLNNYTLPEEIRYDMSKELGILYKEHDKLLLTYAEKNPNSEIAFWALARLMIFGYEPIFDSIFNSFSDQLKNGYAGKVLNTKLMEGKLLTVGKYFPLMSCADINSKPFTLDIFKDSRFTLVDFWYSGCGPCRAQFVTLKNLYNQFKNKGFEIVGLSVDRETDKKKWEDIIINEKLIWQQYWDINGKDSHRLSINAFPTNFLVENTGKIIAKNISLGELEEVLSKSLK
ncbi:MAG: TlpA disulfide reductase family protein [Lentimicrobiaceae bacterium]|jgi:thiol-disulfide isomerase/thioredoxin